jgi:sugar/nucleoside kinase (ribokinase family)
MKKYDVYGIGNALVDILVPIQDDFLSKNSIHKGIMTLLDETKQATYLVQLEDRERTLRSGGSAANSLISIASSGGKCVFSGKVSHDVYGEAYKQDMELAGVSFLNSPLTQGHTGTCLILTSPDAERTMLTSLGVSSHLSESDLNEDFIKESKFVYIEGYLWDSPTARDASKKSISLAKANNTNVAFTFSDPFCVDRYREDFIELANQHISHLFCNFDEAKSISGKSEIQDIISFFKSFPCLSFITNGEKGAIVISDGTSELVPGFPAKAIDTTGAGDAFAAGVLYGLSHNYNPTDSARYGNYIASQVVQIMGPRLTESLKGKIKEILK